MGQLKVAFVRHKPIEQALKRKNRDSSCQDRGEQRDTQHEEPPRDWRAGLPCHNVQVYAAPDAKRAGRVDFVALSACLAVPLDEDSPYQTDSPLVWLARALGLVTTALADGDWDRWANRTLPWARSE